MNVEFRSPEISDKAILEKWILADSDHNGRITPDFFFSPEHMTLVLSSQGEPGLYVRIDPLPPDSVRLHIQFGPSKLKSGKTLICGWEMFRYKIREAGIKRMVFESTSPALIGFCCRHLGFSPIDGTHDYELRIS